MQLDKYVVMLLTDYFASQRMQNSTVCSSGINAAKRGNAVGNSAFACNDITINVLFKGQWI